MKNGLLQSLQQLVLQSRCAMCQRLSFGLICPDCRRQLETCQLAIPLAFVDMLPLLAWGHYQGPLKQLLGRLKYDQQAQVARLLGQLLGVTWLETQSHHRQPIVVPIPLHKVRQRERGYNQSALIANSFCQFTGLNVMLNGLVRVRATAAQFSLSPQDRLTNVSEAFRVGPELAQKSRGSKIVLLDDIYTTGATINSAVETLSQAGFQVVEIVVVAKA
ncbi:ComF family protein [Acaryochloris marina]|nr:ComF family protein [Acaryochloris marina]